ncbi:MAG: sigma-54 dependent transcriptional regulator [Desulfobacteraceae bacterium]|nr:sigma-54 dependent transcriptional regulator [Desulfobacteraceae bacterium]
MSERVRILIVDDELIVRESLVGWLKKAGHEVDAAAGGGQALEMLQRNDYDLVFLDLKMPDMNGFVVLKNIKARFPHTLVVMITAFGSVETAIEAMKTGADDFLVKPFDPGGLQLLVEKLLKQKRLVDENATLRNQLDNNSRYQDLIGSSECMRRLFSFIDQVAGVDSPVLLQGETGTGKELAAKAIHARSNRRYGPFIPINCGAFTETLLESELFGHEAGSFTGATRTQKGRLEMARGGTLFLDEIGEIPLKMQVDLLRVLQEKSFHRVGGNRDIAVDFRLISATHHDLLKKVTRAEFRQDFYFRLKVIEIEVPPLRERRDDIPILSGHFLQKFRRETNKAVKGIRDDAMMVLQAYDWPGNVRELENTIERAVVLAKNPFLKREDFGFLCIPVEPEAPLAMRDVEKNHIERILKRCRWNISKAALLLEITRVTLHHKIKKYGLKPPE